MKLPIDILSKIASYLDNDTNLCVFGLPEKYCITRIDDIDIIEYEHFKEFPNVHTLLFYNPSFNKFIDDTNIIWKNKIKSLYCYIELSMLPNKGLEYLKELYISNNSITELPTKGLENLKILDCHNNKLTRLPSQGLENLRYLRCSDNKLTELPSQGLENLEILYCYGNKITELPTKGYDNVKQLSCSYNRITKLFLKGFPKLEKLDHNGKYWDLTIK
jgi:Leucine-rich repeat (LRR) protein